MSSPIRLSVVMTHPIQYYAPWFRYITENVADVELKVHYCVTPTPKQQGVGFDKPFEWDDSALLDGYDFEILRKPSRWISIHSSSFFGVAVPQVATALRKAKPDAVLVPGWYSVSLVAAALTARLSGVPVLYRGDSQLQLPWRGTLRKRLRTWAMLELFTHYLSVGKRNYEFLRNYSIPESQIFFAPHCVDNEFFANAAASVDRTAARSEWGIASDSFVILFAGKFEEQKRPWDVIEAAGKMTPAPTVVMAGSGECEERCREAARNSSANVVFTGFRSQAEIAHLYGLCDCLVLPSQSETWGLVVNEALASGLPCVVSDHVGCAPDLIDEGVTGYVTPLADVASMTAALTRLRGLLASGHSFKRDCQEHAAAYSFATATRGLHTALTVATGRSK